MKKVICILLVILSAHHAKAQSRPDSAQHNQIGLDVAYGVRTYLNFNEITFPEMPEYLIMYRRVFTHGSLRIAGNFSLSIENPQPYFEEDSNQYRNAETSIQGKIGYEWHRMLDDRWQIYYGIDATVAKTDVNLDLNYYNGGYANGIESTFMQCGLSPFLGVRVYCTPRISLTTETSVLWAIESYQLTRTEIPISGDYPVVDDEVHPALTTIHTIYTPPVSLTLNFSL